MDNKWIKVTKQLPDSGKPVFCVAGNKIIRAVYADKYSLSVDEFGDFETSADYDEDTDTFYWPEGWYEWNEFEETHWFVDEVVTHWMHLPECFLITNPH